ncbi:MAG: hypothetical protein AAF670_00380 [Planctomycetota bacterium]
MTILRWLPRFRHVERRLRELEARESWSRTQVRDYQLERINAVWDHASRFVPFYRSLSTSLPARFDSLEEYSATMPFLTKGTVRAESYSLLSERARPGRWYRSGGSTGEPTAIYWDDESHRAFLRGKYRCEQAHGINVFDKKTFLWGHAGSFTPGLKGTCQRLVRPVGDSLRNRQRISAYDLSADRLCEGLNRIKSFGPRSLYGYSSAVELLARVAAQHNVELPTLNVAILTAEPSDIPMRDQISESFQCRSLVEYGAVECGLIAYTVPDGTMRCRDDLVFVETVPNCQSGFDIVITVLNNSSFPLLRYRMEDTTARAKRCPEHGFTILDEIRGRSNDVLIGRDGRKLHPMALKHLVEPYPEVRRLTAHQDCAGGLRVQFETAEVLESSVIELMRSRLTEMMQGYPVDIETTGRIRGNRAGKHRWITSDFLVRELGRESIVQSDPPRSTDRREVNSG